MRFYIFAMERSLGVLLQISLAMSFQLLPRSPAPENLASASHQHDAYVDQKIQNVPYTALNHQLWHQRNVITSLASSSKTLGGSSTAALPSTPAGPSATSEAQAQIKALDSTKLSPVKWDSRQEFGCQAALDAMEGIADNPSGIVACYIVRGLNNTTGVFQAGLRLYLMGAPATFWAQIKGAGVNIGLTYLGASVTQQMNQKEKRDDTALAAARSIKEAESEEHTSLLKRSIQLSPTFLESLSFFCVVHQNLLGQLKNSEQNASKILLPVVELSAFAANETRITIPVTLSYVNEFFSNTTNPSDEKWTPEEYEYAKKVLGLTNTFAVFPVGLVITSIWAALLMAVNGYEIMRKLESRDSYRRRLKRSLSNRTTKPYVETRSGVQFEDVK